MTDIEKSGPSPSDMLRRLTIRLTPEQRRRIKNIANDLDTTIQEVAVASFNCFFLARGLDPIDPDSPLTPPKKRNKARGSEA
jgi:hypothetical protein